MLQISFVSTTVQYDMVNKILNEWLKTIGITFWKGRLTEVSIRALVNFINHKRTINSDRDNWQTGCMLDYLADNCNGVCVNGDCSKDTEGNPRCLCHDGYQGLQCEQKTGKLIFVVGNWTILRTII